MGLTEPAFFHHQSSSSLTRKAGAVWQPRE